MIMHNRLKPYIISIALTLLAGVLGGIATKNGLPAYELLTKPALTPPSIAFPIAWTVLYVLMGIGAAMVWNTNDVRKGRALLLYVIQLAVNALWSFWFFGKQLLQFSFLWLILLWVLVFAMTVEFSHINRKAAALQLPYLLWLTFAGYLNLAIWLLNR